MSRRARPLAGRGPMTAEEWTIELESQWMGRDLEYFASLDSTNQYLKTRLRRENVPLGAAVVADEQTKGRGRLGREWWSPPRGGLYTSLVVYPGKDLSGLISLMAGVALSEAIEAETSLDPGLKWPNDVLVAGKKCAGILVEAGPAPEPWAVMGIGVNVEGIIREDLDHAITLAMAQNSAVSRIHLWARLCSRLEVWYETWLTRGGGPILAAWRERSLTLHQRVDVLAMGRVEFSGYARDIDGDGALLVETSGGQLRRVQAGEVGIRLEGGLYGPP